LGRLPAQSRLFTDTTQFMDIQRGDVLDLEGRRFVIRGQESEGRFGLDGEPKPWVKTALTWEDGAARILKLVFYEEFWLNIGSLRMHCFRSPRKESRILDLVRGDDRFMQGVTLHDDAGNPVRILERVQGRPLDQILEELPVSHEEYVQLYLRTILERLVESFQAIAMLHGQGERHGDIRRDHLFVRRQDGHYTWIDFDYSFESQENLFGLDIFGLGNVLCYVVGKGIPILSQLRRRAPQVFQRLNPGDISLVFANRVFNLRKVYPQVPERLNRILMHFSASTPVFYESAEELLNDLVPALDDLPVSSQEVPYA